MKHVLATKTMPFSAELWLYWQAQCIDIQQFNLTNQSQLRVKDTCLKHLLPNKEDVFLSIDQTHQIGVHTACLSPNNSSSVVTLQLGDQLILTIQDLKICIKACAPVEKEPPSFNIFVLPNDSRVFMWAFLILLGLFLIGFLALSLTTRNRPSMPILFIQENTPKTMLVDSVFLETIKSKEPPSFSVRTVKETTQPQKRDTHWAKKSTSHMPQTTQAQTQVLNQLLKTQTQPKNLKTQTDLNTWLSKPALLPKTSAQFTAPIKSFAPQMSAGLKRSDVEPVVQSYFSKIRYCYEKELQKKPQLQGKIVIHFIINPQGHAEQSLIQESSVQDDRVHQCLIQLFNQMVFEKPLKQSNVDVLFPFVFTQTP